jgi:hypothetical protein
MPATACARRGRDPATGVDKHYGYAFQWFALSRRPLLYAVYGYRARYSTPLAAAVSLRAPASRADTALGLTVHALPEPGTRRAGERGPGWAAGPCWRCCWPARPRSIASYLAYYVV